MKKQILAAALVLGASIVSHGMVLCASGTFTVAEDGALKADIVLPAKPLDAERYAADELKHHLDKAFGASAEIVRENDFDAAAYPFHFYIGATAAARAAGLPGHTLKRDEHIVRTVGNGMFLLGHDSKIVYKDIGNVWNLTLYATVYAVYDFLETEMGVTWIWPGPTGEVIPKRKTLVVRAIDRTGIEPLEERYYYGTAAGGGRHVGFSNLASLMNFYAEQSRFLVRHRVGRRRLIVTGHSFNDWWDRFGKTHPEYFNQLPGGVRRPASHPPLVTMCVSQPGVWQQKVEDWRKWWAATGREGGYAPFVNCCENDYVGLCQCANCRAWDAPDPRFAQSDYWNGKMTLADIDRIRKELGVYGLNGLLNDNRWDMRPVDLSKRPIAPLADRYVKFYNAVQAEVRKTDPAARVYGYAYENYLEPPKETRVDPSVVICHVPRSYFPYDQAESDYFRAGWLGWRKAGARELDYRPNYMLAGGNCPFDQGRLILDDFAFAYTNGMAACAFDSLRGSWACHTVMDYALTRAFREPLHGYDRARREILSAFGAASREVAQYFDAIARNTAKWTVADARRMAKENRVGRHNGGSFQACAAIVGDFFDEKFFADGYACLDRAVKAAQGDGEVIARIAYLRKGLRDAELTRRTRLAQKAMDAAPGDVAKKAAFGAAFQAMNDYRASVEDDCICNFQCWAWNERNMNWPHGYTTRPTKAPADSGALKAAGDAVCQIDKTGEIADGGTFVDCTLRPEAGSEIRCRIELPAAEKWSGELWGVGISSQGGYIPSVSEYSKAGHAVVVSDLGTTRYEKGDMRGKPWTEPVFRDYSWRATHLMTVYAKRFVKARYGRDARHAYFRGGSCGGRQGLSEAMRFPADYDGILSVIPAAMLVDANAQAFNVYRQTHDASGKALFTTNQLAVLAESAIAYMKDRDVKPYAGSVLSNPFFSEADIDGLLAFVAKREPSLAAPDLQRRMKNIMLGAKDAKGRTLCHGMLPGVRLGNPYGMSFRSKGLCIASVLRNGAKYAKYPSWDEFEEKAVKRGSEINASSFDLSAFARRGGKLIVTCGWEDQTTPAPGIVAWYEYLAEANGGFAKTQRFCRLFPLPGVAHGGGQGRITTGGGAVRNVHMDSLRRWVEKGVAPETYPLAWSARNLTLPIPPYPLQCYLGDDGTWKTRRYPKGMVRRPHSRYYETKSFSTY